MLVKRDPHTSKFYLADDSGNAIGMPRYNTRRAAEKAAEHFTAASAGKPREVRHGRIRNAGEQRGNR
jgi:hypothetical protein